MRFLDIKQTLFGERVQRGEEREWALLRAAEPHEIEAVEADADARRVGVRGKAELPYAVEDKGIGYRV
jgi:hypothetical protein